MDTATRILDSLYSSIKSLELFSNRFKEIIVGETKFREMIVRKFRVIYSVDLDNYVVVVERVLYIGRDISKIAIG